MASRPRRLCLRRGWGIKFTTEHLRLAKDVFIPIFSRFGDPTSGATSFKIEFNLLLSHIDDGRTDTLIWTIRKAADAKYTGREALIDGEQAGCAFHRKYTRDAPQADGEKTNLNFDDWFYRIDERTCIVRRSAGRAGLPFVTAHVTYRKV